MRSMVVCAVTSLVLVVSSCVEFPELVDPEITRTLEQVSDSVLDGIVGKELDPIVVKLVDADGQPVEDAEVTWTVGEGGGSVEDQRSETDEDGKASTVWTLGTTAGTQQLTASAANALPVTFTATAEADVPASLIATSPDSVAGTVGTELDSLGVLLTDAHENPVPGRRVSWEVIGEGGSISPRSSNTGEDGTARAVWTLGTRAGEQQLRARFRGLDPVTFTATALPGEPEALESVGPTSFADMTVGSDTTVTVRVTDAHGNGVPEVEVAWSVEEGGGDVEPGTSVTDENGEASTVWTVGTEAGENVVRAQVEGLDDSVTFTATTTAAVRRAIAGGGT